MSPSPMAGGLLARRRAATFPTTFFTNLSSRHARILHPRYFISTPILSSQTAAGAGAGAATTPRSTFSVLRNFGIFRSLATPFRKNSRSISSRSSKPLRNSTVNGCIIRRPSIRTFKTTVPNLNQQHLSLSQKWRQLSKEYGYSAIGVYFLLSLVDFPFCFLLVRYLGSEKIAHYEHIIIEGFWGAMPASIQQYRPKVIKEAKMQQEEHQQHMQMQAVGGGPGGDIDSYAHSGGAAVPSFSSSSSSSSSSTTTTTTSPSGENLNVSIWTELALAYAVHKSLIFFRVPLAAAVTPKIVHKLRSWGFNIGKKGGVRQGYKDVKERRAAKKGI